MTSINSSVTIKAAAFNKSVTTADINQAHTATSSSPTMIKRGYCEVGKSYGRNSYFNLEHTIKIYYEIHGNGPNKLLFIMGTLRSVT